jgi:hypothetical protein
MAILAPSELASVLLDLVGRRCPTPWVHGAATVADPSALEAAFDETTRHVGAAALVLDGTERERLHALGITWTLQGWGVDDAARAALLAHAAVRLDDDALQALVERRWGAGDGRQRCAILRALPLLPRAERFLVLALQARRGAVRRVFEALACDNPYPATHFHDVHFTDMVAAALEADLPLARIVELDRRLTPELAGRAARFAAVRRAAGRSVPDDLWRVSGALRSAA